MTAYLIEHPPLIRQYRERGTTPSGVIVLHTAESFPDEVGPDDGAENVAAFIRNRTTFGSYHDVVDSDSIVDLVPGHLQAYGDGTGSNPHAFHISAATQAARWESLPAEWVDGTVRNMARSAARFARWLHKEHGIAIPPRRVTREESEKRLPGFISHGERDPGRRSDPGAAFPWPRFLNYYAEELRPPAQPKPVPTKETRGKAVDVALARVGRAIEALEGAKAPEGSDRETDLAEALDALLVARRELREVKAFHVKIKEGNR